MKSPKKKSKKKNKKFGEPEFVQTLWKTMKDQAKENPSIDLLHERIEGAIQLIGLTGGIASGKSTVSRFLQGAKVPVIDADGIARQVVRPGKPTYRMIVKAFGDGILQTNQPRHKRGVEGEAPRALPVEGMTRAPMIDRDRLGEIVFADDAKRALLESITHPAILKEVAKRVRALRKKKSKFVVIDAALLFESGLHRHMHKTIFVRIEPGAQMERLMQRDNLPEAKAWQRILSQMPSSQKESQADFVIDNSGPPKETHRQVLGLLSQLANQ